MIALIESVHFFRVYSTQFVSENLIYKNMINTQKPYRCPISACWSLGTMVGLPFLEKATEKEVDELQKQTKTHIYDSA